MSLWSRLFSGSVETPSAPKVPFGAPLVQQGRADDLMNTLTGLGQKNRDSRTYADWQVVPLTQDQLEAMYRESDTAATIVDVPVDEMFRRGFDLLVGEDPKSQDVASATMARLDETDMLERLHEAMCWSRAYGGSAAFIGADDGLDPVEPLAEDRIVKFDSLTTLTPKELRPVQWDEDLKSSRYGQPILYQIVLQPMPTASAVGMPMPRQPSARLLDTRQVLVHHTRLIRFDGVRVSRRHAINNPEAYGWGDSILQRPRWLIRDFDTAWQAAARILMTFSIAKYKMKGLAEILDQEDSSRALFARIAAIKQSIVAAGMVVMDAEEEVSMESTSVAGLADLLQGMAVRLAAAARMPVTVLMGQAPAGLNATGDSDIRNWYSQVSALQNKLQVPALKRVLRLLFLSADGPTGGVEPEDWRIKPKALWEPSDTEAAAIRLQQAQVDEKYIVNGVLSPEEVGVSRFGGAQYSVETVIDADARKEGGAPPPPDPEAKAKEAQALAAAQAKAKPGNGVPVKA